MIKLKMKETDLELGLRDEDGLRWTIVRRGRAPQEIADLWVRFLNEHFGEGWSPEDGGYVPDYRAAVASAAAEELKADIIQRDPPLTETNREIY